MKKIGLIGGMSWESSLLYYQIINQEVNKRLGGQHSAECIMYSVNFAEIEELQSKNDWEHLTYHMARAARSLERAGANFVLICTNTMHKVAPAVQTEIEIPLLHIADAVGDCIVNQQMKTVGLLGTKFTMEEDFYKQRLSEKYNLDVMIPGRRDRQYVHDVIYKELCHGQINDDSRKRFVEIIDQLYKSGVEGVILGCTEIPLLIKQVDVYPKIFDTVYIHAIKAVDIALS